MSTNDCSSGSGPSTLPSSEFFSLPAPGSRRPATASSSCTAASTVRPRNGSGWRYFRYRSNSGGMYCSNGRNSGRLKVRCGTSCPRSREDAASAVGEGSKTKAIARSTASGQLAGATGPIHRLMSRCGKSSSKLPRRKRHPVSAITESSDVRSQCSPEPGASGKSRATSTRQTISGAWARRLSWAGRVSQHRARTCSQSAMWRLTCWRRSRASPSGRSISNGPNRSARTLARRAAEPSASVAISDGHPRGKAARVRTSVARSWSAPNQSSFSSSAKVRWTGAPSPK